MHREHEAADVVHQNMIDAPEIDANRRERGPAWQRCDGFAQAGEAFVPQSSNVPVIMPREGSERVWETVHLRQREPVGGPFAQDDAAAGRTKIERSGKGGA